MLAKPVLGDHVGEWSTKGGRETLATDDVLAKTIDITRLQVPPRAPKKTDTHLCVCLFYLPAGLERAAPAYGWCKI